MLRTTPKRLISIFFLVIATASCGGSGDSSDPNTNSQNTTTNPAPLVSAVAPVSAPGVVSESFEDPQLPVVENAVLRHVHRNAFSFPVDVNGTYIDSPNATVEIRGPLDIYFPIDQNENLTWTIEPEDNGLAYFRIINTKPNGAVRVHNFHGVLPGHYITFDSTDVDNDIPASTINAMCRHVDIRVAVSTDESSILKLQVNGTRRSRSERSGGSDTLVEGVQLCAVNEDYYFAMVTWESSPGNVQYGFDYYRNLSDGDLLELNLDYQSTAIPWSSDVTIDNDFVLSGNNERWSTTQKLFTGSYSEDEARLVPLFGELDMDSFIFRASDGIRLGSRSFEREFNVGLTSLDLDLNDIVYEEVELTPVDIKWQSLGSEAAASVSGVIFDSSLTQTYAFMSMDPEVISEQEFNFPLQDLELLLDSSFIAMNATAPGVNSGNLSYLTTAGIYSGFVYLPNGIANQRNFNSDHLISVNISEALETLLVAAWEQLLRGWETQQNQN